MLLIREGKSPLEAIQQRVYIGVVKGSAKLADVARAAGVSQGTASNVFNRPGIVRPEVRARVEASARRLGYAGPDPKGRLLRAGKVNAIGFVMADRMAYAFHDPFMRLVLAGIAEECDLRGAGLALVSASQEDAAWRLQTAVLDGFIVHCLKVGDDLIALARERNLPFVAIDLHAGPGTSSVLVDDRRGAVLAARHLVELGHRRIALLSLETCSVACFGRIDAGRLRAAEYRALRERAAGYAEGLAEQGIDLDRIPIVEVPNERQSATRYADELLSASPETTAILAMSDVLAMAAVDAARARGLRVPQDLSVVGFDDVSEAAAFDPPLTTVAQPIVEKGRLAARLILEPGLPRTESLPVKLVVRGSTAPPAPSGRS